MTTNKDFRVKNGLVVEQDANIGGDLVVTGTITGDGSGLSGVTSYTQTDFDNDFATKSTTDLAEGTNLYYTDARFDTRLATKDTDDLAEGTNLYYTTARANSDFDSRLTLKSTSDLTEGTNLYYTSTRANSDFDTRLATKSTTNLSEGTNLYYTDARVGSYLSTNSYATESYVSTAISNLVDTAPTTLDTLNELAAALGDDPNFATTVATSIGTKWTQDNTKISNWDTAYGWGNHASAGYASDSSVVKLTGDQTIDGVKTFSSNPILSGGTANGVAYLNDSKVLTTGSALVFDGANLGIGTSPSYKLHVSGDIYATGNVTAYSDRTLKDNIKPVDNALELVKKMRGVTYTRKDTGEAGVGVIAQEMQEVLPEVVMDKDGVMGVAYGNIVGVLIEAIKEQQKQIDELKQKLSENK